MLKVQKQHASVLVVFMMHPAESVMLSKVTDGLLYRSC